MKIESVCVQRYRGPGDLTNYQWNVSAWIEGQRYWAEGLTYDEALGCVASLLSDMGAHALRILKTTEQHEAWRKRHEESIANIADRIDSAPTDQRREPVLVGSVQCLAERLALKGDAAFAYKVCEEAGVEPPANVKREIEGDAAQPFTPQEPQQPATSPCLECGTPISLGVAFCSAACARKAGSRAEARVGK